MRKFVLIALIIFIINKIYIYSNTIYGDKKPVELFYPYCWQYGYYWRGMSFESWETRQDLAVIVHVIGDRLTDTFSRKSYGKSLKELNKETRQKGLIFWIEEKNKNSVLLISAISISKIKEELNNNNEFISALNKIWELGGRGFKSIEKDIAEKKKAYSVNNSVEKSTFTLFYGKEKDLYNRRNGLSLGGATHLIYYKNSNKEYFLTSIKIIGNYNGDSNKGFYFIIKDINGKPVFMSERYKFNLFSKNNYKIKEFGVNLDKQIEEFYIEVITDSSRENGLFIAGIPSEISYSYKNNGVYKEYEELENENWCIFPEFGKENINKKIINYIPKSALTKEYEFNKLKSGAYPHYIFEKKALKYKDIISETLKVSKKVNQIKFGVINNIELINILDNPQIIEVHKKNQDRTYCFIYGNYIFCFTDNILTEYGVANKVSIFIYGESIKIGSSVDEVFDLVGKPKKTITGANEDENKFKDQFFYKDINNWQGCHSYSIDKLGVRFNFWDNKVSVIWQYKPKNNKETKFKLEYKGSSNLNSLSFILKNKNIFYLASQESSESFWDIFETKLYQTHVYCFGSFYFYKLFEDDDLRKYFSIFSYIESREDQYNHYNIIKLFFDITKEEIDNQVSENTSLIFYKERKGKEPILLIAALDEDNMKKIYHVLKNKTTINEGMYIINHDE